MLFNEALNAMKEGKMARRCHWSLEDGYLVVMDGAKHIWKILTSPQPNAGNHIPSVEELSADDWEVKERGQFAESGPCASPAIFDKQS